MSASLLTACRLGDHAAAAHCLEQYRPAAAPAASPAERTRISLALNASEASGWSPLLYAARNAWSDIVKSLLEFNTLLDTHAKLNSSGNTALHIASVHGHVDVVRQLLKFSKPQHHQQPVPFSLGHPHTNRTRGTVANSQLQEHICHEAAAPCNSSAKAATPGPAAQQQPSTLLTCPPGNSGSSRRGSRRPVTSPKGPAAPPASSLAVDVTNHNGDTPLMFAMGGGHLGVAAELLNAGACPAAANAVGITPLLAGAGHGHLLCLQLLKRHTTAAVQERESSSSSSPTLGASWLACSWQDLLAASDLHGRTALHFAAAAGEAAVVSLLLSSPGGINLWAVSDVGRTAFKEAQQSGHDACARMIKQAMEREAQQAEAAAASLLQQEQNHITTAQQQQVKATARSPGSKPRHVMADSRQDVEAPIKQQQQQQQGQEEQQQCQGVDHDRQSTLSVQAAQVSSSAAFDCPPSVGNMDDGSGSWTTVAVRRQARVKGTAAAAGGSPGEAKQRARHAAAEPQRQPHGQPSTCRAVEAAPAAPPRHAPVKHRGKAAWAHEDLAMACSGDAACPATTGAAVPAVEVPANDSNDAAVPGDIIALDDQQQSDQQQQELAGVALVQQQQPQQPPAWWDEALSLMAAAAPAAAALDLQPQHVLGVSLGELSMSQLDTLELIHRAALVTLFDTRLQLANQQHAQEAQERQKLKQEIRELASAAKAGPVNASTNVV